VVFRAFGSTNRLKVPNADMGWKHYVLCGAPGTESYCASSSHAVPLSEALLSPWKSKLHLVSKFVYVMVRPELDNEHATAARRVVIGEERDRGGVWGAENEAARNLSTIPTTEGSRVLNG
jgi:hypothetical protein